MASANDKLRAMLDELEIEHADAGYMLHSPITAWHSHGSTFCFVEGRDGETDLHIENATPEQAIAATLGTLTRCGANPDGLPAGLTISRDGTLLNWRGENYVRQSALCGGKLTAEQVFEVIERCVKFYEGGDYDAQEIADELNATLEDGTCVLVYGEDDEGYDGWYCQSCGGWFDAVFRDRRLVSPKRCGCCGKAVKR